MREVNFSIPSANKAAVSITTALYDRRALDCTSDLPLINSLNNLAYLTTSSGRIRDILTIDGGIERLVSILKEGRSKKMMEIWKWNLAFQCIVNIGVRGSETVRTRVVEADMVPVIATILDNYFQVIDRCKKRAEQENKRKCQLPSLSSRSATRLSSRAERSERYERHHERHDSSSSQHHRSERSRRHAPPPPIAIPDTRDTQQQADTDDTQSQITPTAPAASLSLSSPPERTTFSRQSSSNGLHHHHHHYHHQQQRSQGQRSQFASSSRQPTADPALTASTLTSSTSTGIRAVRDIDRLPSMLPALNAELSSQPQSPTTPVNTAAGPGSSVSMLPAAGTRPTRPSIRHQLSISGSDDGGPADDVVSDASNEPETQGDTVNVQPADIVMRDITDDDTILGASDDPVAFAVPGISTNEDETFNITHHRTSIDGSAVNPAVTPTQGRATFAQALPSPVMNPLNATTPNMPQTHAWLPARQPFDRLAPAASVLAAMPRDEDVLMSLQLLAYVSKYCNLRSYFQQTHLVPRLKIGKELRKLDLDYDPANDKDGDDEDAADKANDEDWDNEFVQKEGEKPYNIFPLIEKFTAKPSSSSRHPSSMSSSPMSPQQGDMQYWAGVVMRNLCRKDDSKGGIRQCAYWQCGKWEEYQRQFAKCRRCRRTKYCSKECQKGAWGSHRFWCVAADDSRDGEAGGSSGSHANGSTTGPNGERHHSHRHHHHHHLHHHHHRTHGHAH